MLTSDELIGLHRNRNDYEPSPENSIQLAYGDHRYVKQTYELLREADVLKLKVLHSINEDFHLSNNITQALLTSDLLSVLVKHFENPSDEIRQQSSLAVVQVCSTALGREHILQKKHIPSIIKLINDKLQAIRLNSYNALLNLTATVTEMDAVLQTNLVEQLVDKLLEEKSPSVLLKTLKMLNQLLYGEGGTQQALKTECIKRLLGVHNHANPLIRESVVSNLACISYNEKGKSDVVEKGAIPLLCHMLSDAVSEVREQTTLCLCSLSQINEGKNQILKQDVNFQNIKSLLSDPSKDTKLNTVQLIANLAEHPVGRQKSFSCLATLKGIVDVDSAYINSTIDVINWKP